MEEQDATTRAERLLSEALARREERERDAAEWRGRLLTLVRDLDGASVPEVLGALYWQSAGLVTAAEIATAAGLHAATLRVIVAPFAPWIECFECGEQLRQALSMSDLRKKGRRCEPCAAEAQARREAELRAAEEERRRMQIEHFQALVSAAEYEADGCVVCGAPQAVAYLRAGVRWERVDSVGDFTVICATCRGALASRAELREAASVATNLI
jgi:hypothetical protein